MSKRTIKARLDELEEEERQYSKFSLTKLFAADETETVDDDRRIVLVDGQLMISSWGECR